MFESEVYKDFPPAVKVWLGGLKDLLSGRHLMCASARLSIYIVVGSVRSAQITQTYLE